MYRGSIPAVVFLAGLGAVSALSCSGCGSRSGPPVEFVVPKGFTGSVWLVLDPDGQHIPLVDGRYRVAVPLGGVLRVRSYEPFEQPHQESARFNDGTPLPVAHGWERAPGGVALRGGGSVGLRGDEKDIEWMTYFVGTEQQYHERQFDSPPPEGR